MVLIVAYMVKKHMKPDFPAVAAPTVRQSFFFFGKQIKQEVTNHTLSGLGERGRNHVT